jgi:hypothetical protein
MLVSDELWDTQWNPGFKQKSFRKKSRELFLEIADFLQR